MGYKKILINGKEQIIEIVATTFKKLKVWSVRFKDGTEVMLYKCGSEWLQRTEDTLDEFSLKTLGVLIDGSGGELGLFTQKPLY